MTETTKTFEFDVTLDELIEANGVEGFNDILDERLSQNPEFDGIIPTDISYDPLTVWPGDTALITIRATFIPDSISGETDDED